MISYVYADWYGITDQYNYFKFDSPDSNSTFALEETGKNNGTVVNAVNGSNGLFNEAYHYDGDNDYISINDPVKNGSFAFSIFLKNEDLTNNNKYPFVLNWVSLYTNSTENKIYFQTINQSEDIELNNFSIINLSDWNNFIVSYDDNTFDQIVYINGENQGTFNNGEIHNMTTGFAISFLLTYAWNGTIDELMTFDRTISEEEAKIIYSCQMPTDNVTWKVVGNCNPENETRINHNVILMNSGNYTLINVTLGLDKIISDGKLLLDENSKLIIG